MPRSNPPQSTTTEKLQQIRTPARSEPLNVRSWRRRLAIRFAAWMRWTHIYLSMFGLAAVLFFSLTGLTLNHTDWVFGTAERQDEAQGQLDPTWLRLDVPGSSTGEGLDLDRQVAKLEVVEHLRQAHGVKGALSEFRVDEGECLVTFKGPGYSADAFIDRGSGRYDLTQIHHGFLALVNDLHKGRDTGPIWSIVIDLSAMLLTLISLTGLILLFYLKLRRVPGMVVVLLGSIILTAVYWFRVP
ncbi:MAG: PepSY-associated TM helix domain-containing protein [Isosphaeraceae bacterium]